MNLHKPTAAAFALVFASATAAAAFPATSTTSLNVRSGPGTEYGVVDTLYPGEQVEVVATSGGWYQIAAGGWASGNYLDEGGVSTSYYVDDGYSDYYASYGYPDYYYGSYPAWYSGGVYFYIRDGKRHHVNRRDLKEARRDYRHEKRDVKQAREQRNKFRGKRKEASQELRQLRKGGGTEKQIRRAERRLDRRKDRVQEGRASFKAERQQLRDARRELRRERRGR